MVASGLVAFLWRHVFNVPNEARLKNAHSPGLVVHFTNNVVVSRFLGLRQQKLLKSAAMHVLATPSDPVE
jgi:hypothetical protein